MGQLSIIQKTFFVHKRLHCKNKPLQLFFTRIIEKPDISCALGQLNMIWKTFFMYKGYDLKNTTFRFLVVRIIADLEMSCTKLASRA